MDSPRENVAALNVERCGFADDLRVLALDSILPLPAAQTRRVVSATPDWVPDTPVSGLARFALGRV